MAERTLRAAKEIVYGGKLDVWLLDEGNSDAGQGRCASGWACTTSAGRGGATWSLTPGTFANKTKHGNHNRWLWEHARRLRRGDVRRHRPRAAAHHGRATARLLPRPGRRVRGRPRSSTATRRTGSPAGPSRPSTCSTASSSGPATGAGCAMLVGTNAAVRTSAIRKGYVDSITEDMATSLKIHATKNQETGRAWRSVYTPDLVAVGEGPSSWTEFFGQQTRWSAGTYDAILRQVWRVSIQAPARRHAALLPDADLLPVRRHRVDHGHRHQRLLPGIRDQQPAHQRGLVAHLLRRRGGHAVPALPVHAAAQREPARAARGPRGCPGCSFRRSPRRSTHAA